MSAPLRNGVNVKKVQKGKVPRQLTTGETINRNMEKIKKIPVQSEQTINEKENNKNYGYLGFAGLKKIKC